MEYTYPQTRHLNCKHVKDQGRKTHDNNTDLGRALFYAVKQKDWTQAFFLMEQGAPFCRVYQYSKDKYYSTVSLVVKSICEARIKSGHQVLSYKFPDRLLDLFIKYDVDLKCHCTNKFTHKCPLFIALNDLQIRKEEEIFKPQNQLVKKLILNGATIKRHYNDERTYNIPWFDVDQLRNYLLSKDKAFKQERQLKNENIKNISSQQIDQMNSLKYNRGVLQNLDQQEQKIKQEEQQEQNILTFNNAIKDANQQYNSYYNVNSNGGTATFKRLKSEFHD
ncbi:hypothetical protein PPERSA_10024 [Pseudocohnilembus persalinus]|uniref:Uncharacterized protein n=1 Tax=Pseudocohnilembus persalinus TaxID=266149 RepID=A0A0V0QJJ7_PSEPJ|nr:hypothetical protein PPERSA_10024 [Pseudocohnilembus persalinus]|eukprot:KRX02407.1 hypothetical protein PPERSA_10024 [Pseudocohnilembus persalinus]